MQFTITVHGTSSGCIHPAPRWLFLATDGTAKTCRSTKSESKQSNGRLWKIASGSSRFCYLENPVGVLPIKANQWIQPWEFGHGETKKTGLILNNLPPLKPTNVVEGRENRVWKMPPSEDRPMLRSLTYQGVADAMAFQWTLSIASSFRLPDPLAPMPPPSTLS